MKGIIEKILQRSWLVVLLGFMMLYMLHGEIQNYVTQFSQLEVKGAISKDATSGTDLDIGNLKLLYVSSKGTPETPDSNLDELFEEGGQEIYSDRELYNTAQKQKMTERFEDEMGEDAEPDPGNAQGLESMAQMSVLDDPDPGLLALLGHSDTGTEITEEDPKPVQIGISDSSKEDDDENAQVATQDKSDGRDLSLREALSRKLNIQGYSDDGIWVNGSFVAKGDRVLDDFRLSRVNVKYGLIYFDLRKPDSSSGEEEVVVLKM